MEFLELAKKRYSARAYEARAVEPEKLERIVQAAHVAPSAANLQPVRLAVVDSDTGLSSLNKAGRMHGAPLAIVVCTDEGRAWHRAGDNMSAALIDAAIAADHMVMEATDLGLGSCWICAFDPHAVARTLNLPDNLRPAIIVVAGYAADKPASPLRHAEQRIPMSNLVINRP